MKKRRLLMLLIVCCLFALPTLAQGGNISMTFKNEALSSALRRLEKAADCKISFSYNDVAPYKVSGELKKATLNGALQFLLDDKPIAYSVNGKMVDIHRQQPRQQRRASREVIGIVRDDTGEPLPGATITSVVGSETSATVSDENGHFKLAIPSEAQQLTVSFIGMKTRTVALSQKTSYDVRLESDAQAVGEVVVNGMFTRRAETYTGSTVTMTQDDLRRVGNTNLIQSIKNLDPSFEIVENLSAGSNPNALPNIQLRGQSGLPDLKGEYESNPNLPLFILDGFEADLTKIIDMDMNRVASVTLLKDAAAKAIYGSKAANGVLVVETKKPEPGKLQVTYSGSLNIQAPDLGSYDLTNAAEKLQVEYNAGLYDYLGYNGVIYWHNPQRQYEYTQEYNRLLQEVARGVDTDWLAQPTRMGYGQKHVVHIEGGDETFRYGADFAYNNIKGVMKGSDRNTYSGGISLSYRYKNILMRDNLEVMYNKGNNSPYGSFSTYAQMNPYLRIRDENGNIMKTLEGRQTTVANPMWNATINTKDYTDYTQFTNNFYIEWMALKDLKLTGRLGLTKTDNGAEIFHPATHTDFYTYTTDELLPRRGRYTHTDGDNFMLTADVTANWSKTIGKNMIYANAGWSLDTQNSNSTTVVAEGFPNDNLDNINFARQYLKDGKPTGTEATTHDVGFIGALSYSYDDRYLSDLSIRYSGSSQFGSDHRWGTFWSAGLGWNVHKEKFMQSVEWLNQLKLRGSYGYTGSQNFSSYQSQATYTYYQSSSYDGNIGAYLMGLANSNLQWQRKEDINLGVDLLALNKRLSFRFDYYIANTDDLLTDVTVPSSTGFTSYKENLGKVQNKGVELHANYRLYNNPSTRSFVNVYATATHNTNKIKQISNSLQSYNDQQTNAVTNRPITRYYEGCSLTAIWAVPSLGIDPATGKDVFVKKDGTTTFTWDSDDLAVCGDTEAKWRGTAGFNADYKGWSLNVGMSFRWGGQIYNQTLVDKVENADLDYNVDRRIFTDRWVNPGNVSRFKDIKDQTTTRATSRFVENQNVWTLSSVNFSYDFAQLKAIKHVGFNRLRLSFDMNDVAYVSSVKIERGTSYPFARSFSFTLQAMF